MEILILYHQGWGDLLTCHGIVRYYSKIYNKINLIMRKDAKKLVDFMYRDLLENNKLNIFYMEKNNIDNKNFEININNYKKLFHGHYYDDLTDIKYNFISRFGYNFYDDYGISSIERINSFDIIRDINLENEKYNLLINSIGDNYTVIHENNQDNLIIDRNKINNKYKIYNLNGTSDILFDNIKIIENAKEIHLIESTYSILIYLLAQKYKLFNNIQIYLHMYVRGGRYKDYCNNINNNWHFVY